MSAVFQILFLGGANIPKRVDGVKLAIDDVCFVFPLGSPELSASVDKISFRLCLLLRELVVKSFQYFVLL
jgi:hypothetical protein